MNKKILCLILTVCIAAAAAFAGCTAQTQDTAAADNTHGKASQMSMPFDPKTVSVTEKTVTLYAGSADTFMNFTLYFMNGGDIPYVSLEDLTFIFEEGDMKLNFEADGNRASYVDTNGYSADFDFDRNTIYFVDYNMFSHDSDKALIDAASLIRSVAPLFQKDDAKSYERYGREITFRLGDYGIPMVHKNGRYYIPLQTFSDVFLSAKSFFSLYNGQDLIFTSALTDDLKDLYYSAPKLERSKELAEFDYNELCFALDHLYGLKDTHRITNFDTFFHECGYDGLLKSTNQTIADEALYQFIALHLDDQHSGLSDVSFRTDKKAYYEVKPDLGQGISANASANQQAEFAKVRAKYYPNGVPHYEEVGNTAYITFDYFVDTGCDDYYSAPREDELDNTLRLMQYAYDRITRKDSPVENVVMDLSLNTGGTSYTAVYVTGLFLGEGQISAADELTGALVSTYYHIDTNRDHVFDEKDTLAGKGYKFYCLETDTSFSCGNQVSNVFKDSNMVTLIGQTSGGGSCIVQPMSTAAGTVFRISGPSRFAFIKNGAFYDIDRGAQPDVYIKDPNFLYDRKALTDYINNQIK
ncbi:MAG: hypothetical protein J6X83_02000 [Methanomicrobium sp.]|nr:hypothetical protein [Methanomicrobium sp.]